MVFATRIQDTQAGSAEISKKCISTHFFFKKVCSNAPKIIIFALPRLVGGAQKPLNLHCKTWFSRLGSRTLRHAPSKTPKSASRHTFAQKKCVQMVQNHDFRTLERASIAPFSKRGKDGAIELTTQEPLRATAHAGEL